MMPLLRRWTLVCAITVCAIVTLYHLAQLTDPDLKPSLFGANASASGTHKKFRWKDIPQRYPVQSMISLPSGTPAPIPKIQHNFVGETAEHKKERQKRLKAVKESFLHSWDGYKKHAWLQDEVAPVSGGYKNDFGGWGATLVDTLDTLCIMGLKKEFAIAVASLKKIDFSTTPLTIVNVFETTIRYLGGFLSAYDLSGGKYPVLLDKAIELGDMLYAAFDTPNRMPIMRWDWKNGASFGPQEASRSAVSAEVGSLSLEFTRLSQLSGDPKYFDAVQRISNEFDQKQNETNMPGLWPIRLNTKDLAFNIDRTYTFGSMADSLYEYFPKQHMLLGGLVDQNRKMYESAIETAKKHLFFRPLNPQNQDILLSGTVKKGVTDHISLEPEGQHLACFTGGMVGVAAKIFDRPGDLETARKLVDGCIWAYESMPTGIMPESFHVVPCPDPDDCTWSKEKWYWGIRRQMNKDASEIESYVQERKVAPGFTDIVDGRYILRPEAIESVFILYRITGDTRLQDKAWEMFKAVDKATRTDIAHAAIADVTDPKSERLDTCESFWMAETLKYYYLIFSDPGVVSLDEYVFNTEAHPLKRPRR